MASSEHVRSGSTRGGFLARTVLVEVVLLVLLLVAVLGQRLSQGRTALAWTRYHAAQGLSAKRPGEHAQQAGHWAAQALDSAAPHPLAAETAWVALGLGRVVERRERAAALALYTEVRDALERARASRWRGLGLDEVAAEAGRLVDAARVPGRP